MTMKNPNQIGSSMAADQDRNYTVMELTAAPKSLSHRCSVSFTALSMRHSPPLPTRVLQWHHSCTARVCVENTITSPSPAVFPTQHSPRHPEDLSGCELLTTAQVPFSLLNPGCLCCNVSHTLPVSSQSYTLTGCVALLYRFLYLHFLLIYIENSPTFLNMFTIQDFFNKRQ